MVLRGAGRSGRTLGKQEQRVAVHEASRGHPSTEDSLGTGSSTHTSLPSSSRPGHNWLFNSLPLGEDPNFHHFQTWAKTVLQRGVVHPRAVESWRVALVILEDGGRGQLVVSAAAGRRMKVHSQGILFSRFHLVSTRIGHVSDNET